MVCGFYCYHHMSSLFFFLFRFMYICLSVWDCIQTYTAVHELCSLLSPHSSSSPSEDTKEMDGWSQSRELAFYLFLLSVVLLLYVCGEWMCTSWLVLV